MSLVQVEPGICTFRVDVTERVLAGVSEIIITLVGLLTVVGEKVTPQLVKNPK